MVERGIPIVLSGPSGSGKDTLRKHFLEKSPEVVFSVSATTRPPREDETDGGDYLFISRTEFEQRIAQGRFVEWAEYVGNLYGTPKEPLEAALASGRDILLVIEVQGAAQVRKAFPDGTFIFVVPPSWEEMDRRLRARRSETDEQVKARLRRAREEIELMDQFDYVIVNDTVNEAVSAIETIRHASRFHLQRMKDELAKRDLAPRAINKSGRRL